MQNLSDCIEIMPSGNSITAVYFSNDGGYGSRLQWMTKANFGFRFVGRNKDQSGDMNNPEHEGYSGCKISSIAAAERLDPMIARLNKFKPKMVIIVGTLLSFAGHWASGEWRAAVFNQKLSEIVEKQVRQGKRSLLLIFATGPFRGVVGWNTS